MSTVNNIWNKLVLVVFLFTTLFLAGTSFFYIAEMSFKTYKQGPYLLVNNPLIILLGVAILTVLFLIVVSGLKKLNYSVTVKRGVSIAVIVIHVVSAVCWLRLNPAGPWADQQLVWDAAKALEFGGISDFVDYISLNPIQAGVIYLMKFFIHITGSTDPIIWRVFNILSLVLLDLGLIELSAELFENTGDQIAILTGLFELLFIPVIFYSTFVYGMLISFALIVWAIYGELKLIHTNNLKWSVLPIVLLPLANVLYGGTMIATIAVAISLLCELASSKKIRFLVVTLLLILFYLVSGKAIRHQLYLDTGISEEVKGEPYAGDIYMGTTSDGIAGPGSFDHSNYAFYWDYGDDAGKYALEEDKKVLKEYLSGERSVKFFFEKTVYQWLDPWFNALVMTCNPNMFEHMPEDFLSFIYGPVPKVIYYGLLRFLNPFVYLMAFIGGIFIFFREKKTSNPMALLPLYFIGGFAFQLLWESKARYCMPYFICLFPLASYGIISLTRSTGLRLSDSSKKHAVAVILAEVVIIMILSVVKLNSREWELDIAEFYSDYNDEPLVYTDASADNDKRAIHSDKITLDNGVYDIDFNYSSDLPANMPYGAKIWIRKRPGNIVFNESEKYISMDEGGHTHFTVYIPFDGCTIHIEVALDGSDVLVVPNDKAGYFLAENVQIKKNVKRGALYSIACAITAMCILNFIAVAIWPAISVLIKKTDNYRETTLPGGYNT